MNGRAARRIHRAALHVHLVGTGLGKSLGDTCREIAKNLKREYKVRPYHKRNPTGYGYVSLTHKGQELRWWGCQNERRRRYPLPKPEPQPLYDDHSRFKGIAEDPDFYDDHSRFKGLSAS